MNKYQRQAHRQWTLGVAAHRAGYYVDRDDGDEHDPDGVEEHREYLARLEAEVAVRGGRA